MTRKILMAILLTVSLAQFASAQYTRPVEEEGPEKKGFDPQRLFFGGNFGLTFGSFYFYQCFTRGGLPVNRQIFCRYAD